jgi:hypothetical protein
MKNKSLKSKTAGRFEIQQKHFFLPEKHPSISKATLL